jgi:hypothetical protein
VNVYSVEDGDSPLVGVDTGAGRSPRNLERSGLADWVVASQEDARVASFSRKDRSAITLAGQAQGDVYWASSSRGVFVSSTFYRSDLPGWVEDYNAVDMAAITANTEWESLIPAAFVPLSRPDTSDYETARVSYFPHRVEDEYTEVTDARRNTWLMEKTPAADVATFGLAARAIRELELGQRGEMDFLAVSFSATDGVGHAYGPFSREQLDNLMRLDRLLGDLMDLLDEEVGEGEWVLGLSSDHGILEIPETISDPPTGRITREDRREMQVAVAAAGVPGDDEEEYAERLAAALSEVPIVARATPVHQLEAAAQTDTTSAFEANSFRPDRRVGSYAQRGVVVRYQDRVLAESGTGTTHGSPYSYDRHVPLIFYGAGIPAGRSTERARTVDFAPTLATLLGIDFPEDLDGRPLFPFRPDALPQRP